MTMRFKLFRSMVLVLALLVAAAGACSAGDSAQNGDLRHRVGAWGTYGASYDGADDYNFYSFNPFWSVFLTDPGPGWRGSWELSLEGFINKYMDDYSSNYEVGFSPTIRWHYGFEKFISPYAELAVGALYNNLDTDETRADIMFDIHWGLGFNVRLSPEWYLGVGYRWRHISNANTHPRNPGVDYNQAVVGLSYYY